ncbi:hypothetical protein K474DRAFT_956912 [Panus rudis PR-1116 ss-1]|nr:hypothetical protein K474DRAFT_956912 [Panus rudis PR-1116 ss-1]
MDLAICTAEKQSDGCIQTHLSRIVPAGYFTALTRTSNVPHWCAADRKEDEPTNIVAYNDAQAPESFAISTVVVNKHEWNPSYLPIVIFNPIKHRSGIRVKRSLTLQAFCGQGFKAKKQLYEKDVMMPVLNDRRKPWSLLVDELENITSYCISRKLSGEICIEKADANDGIHVAAKVKQELQVVKARLEALQAQSGEMEWIYSEISALKQLRSRIEELEEQIDRLQGSSRSDDGLFLEKMYSFESELSSIKSKLQSYNDVPKSPLLGRTRQSLTARLDATEVSSADLGRLHASIARVETRLNGVDKTLETIPAIQEAVTDLQQASDQAFQEIDVVDRAVKAVEIERQSKLAAIERRLQEMNKEVNTVREQSSTFGATVRQTEERVGSKVKDLIEQLSKKAEKTEVQNLETVFGHVAQKMRGIEGSTIGLHNSMSDITTRMDKVETGLKDVKGRVQECVAKFEGGDLANVQRELRRGFQEVNIHFQRVEGNIQKIESGQATIDTQLKATASKTASDIQRLQTHFQEVERVAKDADQRGRRVESVTGEVKSEVRTWAKKTEVVDAGLRAMNGRFDTIDGGVRELSKEVKQISGTKFWHTNYWKS